MFGHLGYVWEIFFRTFFFFEKKNEKKFDYQLFLKQIFENHNENGLFSYNIFKVIFSYFHLCRLLILL